MSAQREPEFNDPVELLDELDAVIREQELLRHRMLAVQARYQALQGQADEGRFDKPSGEPYVREEYGSLNVKWAAQELGQAAKFAEYGVKYLGDARADAVKVREYPQPQPRKSALARHRADAADRDGAER